MNPQAQPRTYNYIEELSSIEKSGDEKFMVEMSEVEKFLVEKSMAIKFLLALGLKCPGLKLGVEKSWVEMSFNHPKYEYNLFFQNILAENSNRHF